MPEINDPKMLSQPATNMLSNAGDLSESDLVQWGAIFLTVQRRLGKDFTECTIGEVQRALVDEQTDRRFDSIALHSIAEPCGCPLRIPRDETGIPRYVEAQVHHTCEGASMRL